VTISSSDVALLRQLAWSWLANAIVLLILVAVLSGVTVDSAGDLFLAAVVFGVLNTILKPFAKLVTAPLALITLGLAWFGVAMLMLKITDWIVDGFDIHGFGTLIWATIIVWVVNLVLDFVPGPWRGTRRD
jgi:putative membrane protein